MSPFTIIQGKEGANPKAPLFMFAITSPDGFVCYLTSADYYGGSALNYGGNSYDARVIGGQFEAMQAISPLGYDSLPGFTISISDADKSIWLNYCMMHGWRGSSVSLTIILWDVPNNSYSTDAIQWTFIGGNPQHDQKSGTTTLEVTSSTNFTRLQVPSVPIQNRCPWDFPATYLQRVAALNDPTSVYYQCGYSADVPSGVGNLIAKTTLSANYTAGSGTIQVTSASGFPSTFPFQATVNGNEFTVLSLASGTTYNVLGGQDGTTDTNASSGDGFYIPFVQCELIRSSPTDPSVGCMARLGNAATTSVASDGDLTHDKAGNYTARFGGVTWIAPSYFNGKAFLSGQKTFGFNSPNTGLAGTYYNWVYGTQWVPGGVLAPAGDPNSLRSEVAVCFSPFGPANVIQVVVNGVTLPQGINSSLFGWGYINQGGRNGVLNNDAIYNRHGDPHGSVCVIEILVPAQLAGPGSVPSVQVLVTGGPILNCYVIASVASGVVSFTGVNSSCAGNPPFSVIISGNSNSSLNSVFELTSWTYGPPGTITLSGSSDSGTGGTVYFLQAPDLFDTGGDIASNPTGMLNNVAGPAANAAFAYLDLLMWGNIPLTQIDSVSFYESAQICATQIEYTAPDGSTQTHAQFKCSFALIGTQQQTLAQIMTGVRNCGNLMVGPNTNTGLIQCFVRLSLADQQPLPIPGSNNTKAYPSTTAGGNALLSSSISNSVTTIPLSYGMVTVTDQIIQIDSEQMQITGGAGTNSLTVTRAFGGTTAASHSSNAVVFPCGYYAYSFDETNIDIETFRVATKRIEETPNTIIIPFQDEQNGYQQDSLTEVDPVSYQFSGNQKIVVPVSIIGVPNFDQGTRVANTILAENEFGNNRNDRGGTLYMEFVCNHRALHLAGRLGYICSFSFSEVGLGVILSGVSINSPQAVRVQSLQFEMDAEKCHLVVAYHDDVWYTWAYGQNPSPFQNNPLLSPPNRPPYPWQPGVFVAFASANTFQIQLNILQYPAQMSIYGISPVNVQPSVKAPTVPLQASTQNTGGAILPGNYTLAVSNNGAVGPVSNFISVIVPTGGSNNKIVINNIVWNAGAAVLVAVFAGDSSMDMTLQGPGTWTGSNNDANGNPTTITITSFTADQQGLPDVIFSKYEVQQTPIIHGGVWGDAIGSITAVHSGLHWNITLNFPEASWGTSGSGQWAGYTLTSYYAAAGGMQPDTTVVIASSDATNLYFTSLSSAPFAAGDVVVMRMSPGSITSNTIGDANFVNSYAPSGLTVNAEAGNLILIIAGTGAGQAPKTIASNTATVFTINGTWDVTPDSTSVCIIVGSSFTPSYTSAVTNDGSTAVSLWGTYPVALGINSQISANSVLIQVATADASGNTAPMSMQPFRELYVPFQGTTHTLGFPIGDPNNTTTPLTTTQVSGVLTVPFAGTIVGWSIALGSGSSGTVTVEFWLVSGGGTAIPTISNLINTSGVSLSTGTRVQSSVVTDFTTKTFPANSLVLMVITAISGTIYSLTGQLQVQ